MPYTASQIRKFLVAVVGFVVTVLTTVLAVGPDLIPDSALPYVHVLIAVASAYGVFAVKNQPQPGVARNPQVSEAAADPGYSTVGLLLCVLCVVFGLYLVATSSLLLGLVLVGIGLLFLLL